MVVFCNRICSAGANGVHMLSKVIFSLPLSLSFSLCLSSLSRSASPSPTGSTEFRRPVEHRRCRASPEGQGRVSSPGRLFANVSGRGRVLWTPRGPAICCHGDRPDVQLQLGLSMAMRSRGAPVCVRPTVELLVLFPPYWGARGRALLVLEQCIEFTWGPSCSPSRVLSSFTLSQHPSSLLSPLFVVMVTDHCLWLLSHWPFHTVYLTRQTYR